MPKTKPPTTALEDQLCFSLYRANLEIGRAYQPVLDTLGITYPQFLVLNTLWEKDGRPVGEIAERLTLESSNITPLIKRLEAAGLLTRQRNPADDRQVLVSLTEQGRAMEHRCSLGELLVSASGMQLKQLVALNDAVQSLLRSIDSTKESNGG
jgi:DNA-binding MarR family transcriptional regulator